MTFKKFVLVMTIAIILLIMGLLGFSYAWYGLTQVGTNFTTVTSNEVNHDVDVVYTQTDVVSITTGVPIASGDVDTKSGKNSFTVYGDPTTLSGYNVLVDISLININIDDSLKVSDFKYQLLENSNVVASGTGATIGSNKTISLKSRSSITLGTTYSYELRVWLEESGASQNSLMGKSFSAKLQVTSAMRK